MPESTCSVSSIGTQHRAGGRVRPDGWADVRELLLDSVSELGVFRSAYGVRYTYVNAAIAELSRRGNDFGDRLPSTSPTDGDALADRWASLVRLHC